MTTKSDIKVALAPKKNRRYYLYAVISLIAMGGMLYAVNIKLHRETEQQLQSLLTTINTLKNQQINTQTELDTVTKINNVAQTKLHLKLKTIDKNLQFALQERLYDSKDWLLLKARYYLELAQINAQWSDNTQTTIALLKQADALLKNISDQRLFNTRKAIAQEITQLQAIPSIDTAGLLSQIDASLALITHLPLKEAVKPESKGIAPTTNNEATSTWRQRLQESVHLLEKLVVVRHHDDDVLPLPSPVYESMLREGIRLNLQEAQWALLRNDDAVYQFSLAQAISNISRSFEPSAADTGVLIKQLQTLQAIHLIQQKPMLEQALPLLNQLIESKNSDVPTASGASKS